MTDKVYLIGNRNEYNDYLNNKNNIDYLPMKNLPIVYFPFHYNNNENSINNIKRYAPIIDNSLTLSTDSLEVRCDESESSVKCSSTDKLFNTLSNIEEEWQPYNNNNLKLILIIIIILWIIIFFMILKTIYYILGETTRYTYFIIILLIILLIMSSIYALIITGRDF
tara:strand:+ start:4856 stop:5356 length:501 start_codon:yes stop_codon:yes gene_type:complete